MNINFHQTFKPEKKHIIEILLLAQNEPEMSIFEISAQTGIPTGKSSGKVLPHLEYAKFMGLITYELTEKKYTLKLTNLGKMILEEDISISEKLTLLLLHAMIIRPEKGADLWNFTYFKFPEKYSKNSTYDFFQKEANDYFSTDVNVTPLKNSYDDFFMDLDLLNIDKKNDIFAINDILYQHEYLYLCTFILYEYWDLFYPNEDEITINQVEKIGFNKIFGWTRKQELEVFQKMADRNLIRINKQLIPFTFLKLREKNEIMNMIYDEMF